MNSWKKAALCDILPLPMQQLRASFLDQAQTYLKADAMRDIRDAYRLMQEEECTCSRHPGETCIAHAEQVTMLLLPRKPDAHTIIACLLQCIHEPETIRKIEERFGKNITGTIASLSIINGGSGGGASVNRPPLQHILLALSKDVRVLLIALHNRWHALRKLEHFDLKHRPLIAREALEVFAPLCARLGIYSLKYELETLAFHTLFKEEADDLEEKLDALRKQYGPFLQESKRTITKLLSQEGKQAMILTREKHPYSIFRKLQRKNLTSITDLHDLFGVRILVDTEEECYEVLGIIHRAYRPIPHRMKDYIAMGKPNGYRSIHTTVLGVNPEELSLPVEIQIRTHEMDEEAEYGIAAHWSYKEQGGATPFAGTAWQKRIEALSAGEVPEGNAEEDLAEEFSDRIFVLTPKGDVVELPKGAGPLDFAFRVHTNIGLRYRHAKVNGAIAPINQQLENGDHVQVTVWSEPKPSEQWIQIVRTKEARQKLRGFFHASVGRETRPAGGTPPFEKRMQKASAPPSRSSPLAVSLESQTPLPYHFASCCRADLHSAQRPPIVGYITREGMVRIHWSGCRMITNANHERLIRATWKATSPLSSAL